MFVQYLNFMYLILWSFFILSLFTFVSHFILLLFLPSTFSSTHVRTMRTGSYAPSAYVIKVTQTFICKCVIFFTIICHGITFNQRSILLRLVRRQAEVKTTRLWFQSSSFAICAFSFVSLNFSNSLIIHKENTKEILNIKMFTKCPSDEKLLVFTLLISPSKIILFE